MEENNTQYNFSLFKPVNKYNRRVSNIIISMLIIWFVAVIGFQFLLRIVQKPTPEETFKTFESVFENVKNGTAGLQEQQQFVKALLLVGGKSSVSKENKAVIDKVLTGIIYKMLPDSEQVVLSGYISELKQAQEKLGKSDKEEYIRLQEILKNIRASINLMLDPKIGIAPDGLESSILPYCLNGGKEDLTEADFMSLHKVVKKYTIHNRSFITDFKFIGFPFHYFYTAVLLLVLFVFLCWLFCIRVQRLQKKFSINEEI